MGNILKSAEAKNAAVFLYNDLEPSQLSAMIKTADEEMKKRKIYPKNPDNKEEWEALKAADTDNEREVALTRIVFDNDLVEKLRRLNQVLADDEKIYPLDIRHAINRYLEEISTENEEEPMRQNGHHGMYRTSTKITVGRPQQLLIEHGEGVAPRNHIVAHKEGIKDNGLMSKTLITPKTKEEHTKEAIHEMVKHHVAPKKVVIEKKMKAAPKEHKEIAGGHKVAKPEVVKPVIAKKKIAIKKKMKAAPKERKETAGGTKKVKVSTKPTISTKGGVVPKKEKVVKKLLHHELAHKVGPGGGGKVSKIKEVAPVKAEVVPIKPPMLKKPPLKKAASMHDVGGSHKKLVTNIGRSVVPPKKVLVVKKKLHHELPHEHEGGGGGGVSKIAPVLPAKKEVVVPVKHAMLKKAASMNDVGGGHKKVIVNPLNKEIPATKIVHVKTAPAHPAMIPKKTLIKKGGPLLIKKAASKPLLVHKAMYHDFGDYYDDDEFDGYYDDDIYGDDEYYEGDEFDDYHYDDDDFDGYYEDEDYYGYYDDEYYDDASAKFAAYDDMDEYYRDSLGHYYYDDNLGEYYNEELQDDTYYKDDDFDDYYEDDEYYDDKDSMSYNDGNAAAQLGAYDDEYGYDDNDYYYDEDSEYSLDYNDNNYGASAYDDDFGDIDYYYGDDDYSMTYDDYDDNYGASAKLDAYDADDDYYYGPPRIGYKGNWYNHRRKLTQYVDDDDEEILNNPNGMGLDTSLILKIMVGLIGLIYLIVAIYRYNKKRKAQSKKEYHKLEVQIMTDGDGIFI